MNQFLRHSLIFVLLTFITLSVQAEEARTISNETIFGQYTIRHVVFNSTFILPKVAEIYHLKRSKYESLINLSVNQEGKTGSIPAEIRGTVTNLMQQQKQLKLQEIKEKDATYYLAPVRIGNEELLHFEIFVKPEGSSKELCVKFSQKVYADE